jgi:hypothetical protein
MTSRRAGGRRSAVYRVSFHLDRGAFRSDVEPRDNPAVKGKPVIVGPSPTKQAVPVIYFPNCFSVSKPFCTVPAASFQPAGRYLSNVALRSSFCGAVSVD